jgi:peptide/nickel transport system permease protein
MHENMKEDIEPWIKETKYTLHLFRKSPLSVTGLAIILLLLAIAIFAPFISSYDPNDVNYEDKLQPPSKEYFFGTDEHGRDLFSRVVYGTRITFFAALSATIISLLIGVTLGIVAAFYGGMVDEVIMRIMDIILSFPYLVLAMSIAAALMGQFGGFAFDPLWAAVIAASIIYIPNYARIVRGQALSVKERPFIEAARSVGAKDRVILFKHLLPNCTAPIIIQASMNLGGVVLTIAALSFIGLGAQPPSPEWGAILSKARHFIAQYWWYATFPGLAIFIFVLGFMLLGDGLRDVLDPRLRR